MFRAAMGHFLVHFLGYSLNSERKAPNEKICRLPEQFWQAVCAFLFIFLSLSDACHEAADFLRGFFFHACRDMGVHVQ